MRRAIRESGLSLHQLDRDTGVHNGRLSRFVRGERDLTLTAAGKVCRALGLVLSKLEAKPAQGEQGKRPAKVKRPAGRAKGGRAG